MTTVRCPDPECRAPAAIVDRWAWNSTHGPVEHVRTRCLARHVFTPPAADLVAGREDYDRELLQMDQNIRPRT